jgi:hypothetical protein
MHADIVGYLPARRHSLPGKHSVRYAEVVPFDRNETGSPCCDRSGSDQRACGRKGAQALALDHAGAVAFSRTGDAATGEFNDAVILAQFGEVDLDALSV